MVGVLEVPTPKAALDGLQQKTSLLLLRRSSRRHCWETEDEVAAVS